MLYCSLLKYSSEFLFPSFLLSFFLLLPLDLATQNPHFPTAPFPDFIRNVSQTQIPLMARLSCERCTKRKVKCDRLIPCTNCRNSGILCIPVERKRRPRGRSRRAMDWPSQAPLDHRDSNDNSPVGFAQYLPGEPFLASSAQTPDTISTHDLSYRASELDNSLRNSRTVYDRVVSSSYSISSSSMCYNTSTGIVPDKGGGVSDSRK